MSENMNIEAEVCGYIQRGIASMEIDNSGDLKVTLTDGTVVNLGPVRKPAFFMEWHEGVGSPTNSEIERNLDVKIAINSRAYGTYDLYLKVDDHIIPAMYISENSFYFFDFSSANNIVSYVIKTTPYNSYMQSKRIFIPADFDEESLHPASSASIAAYIEERIAAHQLVAGDGITISNGVISLSGGAS